MIINLGYKMSKEDKEILKALLILSIIAILLLIQPLSIIATTTSDDENNLEYICDRNAQGEEVVNVQMRLRDLGYFNYKVTGFYGLYTKDAVMRFQMENNIQADGQVGPQTKETLYSTDAKRFVPSEGVPINRGGSSAATGSLIEWFSRGQYIYRIGDIATVTDVNTGIRYNMKRTGGSYHADVEPVTASDTRKIKQIWGGWSWARRAVLVSVNGYTIAASSHGMPHAYDYVSGNDMTGHVCIHFYKSRTHINNAQDPDHQAMVMKAAGR